MIHDFLILFQCVQSTIFKSACKILIYFAAAGIKIRNTERQERPTWNRNKPNRPEIDLSAFQGTQMNEFREYKQTFRNSYLQQVEGWVAGCPAAAQGAACSQAVGSRVGVGVGGLAVAVAPHLGSAEVGRAAYWAN